MALTSRSSAGREPRISVLIVNYRSTVLLEACLAALHRSAWTDLEIVVVDNASPEFEADALRMKYPDVVFIPLETNLTFTGGTNRAFAASTGDYVLFLNPDTEIDPAALDAAVELLRDPQTVAVAAHLFDIGGAPQPYYRRLPHALDIPTVLLPGMFRRTARGRAYLMLDLAIGPATEVEQPPGAFLLVRRSDLEMPPLDPTYFNFFSDVELCRYLNAKGRIVASNRVRSLHHRGAAGVRTSSWLDQVRLYHDLTWGVRRYFRTSSGSARLYLEVWLFLFWLIRLAQASTQGSAAVWTTLRAGTAALRGLPPSYET